MLLSRSGEIDSDLEIGIFYGYHTAHSTMRIKIKLQQSEQPTIMKGPFTSEQRFLYSNFLVPNIVCSTGKQYSLFKNNGAYSNQEYVYIWGTVPTTGTKKLLLSLPSNTDYVSYMVDVCIPNQMENVQLMLKSIGGGSWGDESYVTIFDSVTESTLLSTTLPEREGVTLPFPLSLAVIPVEVTIRTPSLQDRALITVWGPYAGLKTMIAVLADPFPFQPHVLQTVHLAANEAEHYELHCSPARSAAMTVSLSVRGRSIAQFSPSNASSILLPIGPLPRDA